MAQRAPLEEKTEKSASHQSGENNLLWNALSCAMLVESVWFGKNVRPKTKCDTYDFPSLELVVWKKISWFTGFVLLSASSLHGDRLTAYALSHLKLVKEFAIPTMCIISLGLLFISKSTLFWAITGSQKNQRCRRLHAGGVFERHVISRISAPFSNTKSGFGNFNCLQRYLSCY